MNKLESRGDILLALQDALTVVDVSVVHPAASTYFYACAHAEGSAAAVRDQAKHVQYDYLDSLGYAFSCKQRLSVGLANMPWRC